MGRRSRILHSTIALAAMGTLLAACADSGSDASTLTVETPSPQAATSTPSQVAFPGGVLPLPRSDASDEAVIAEPGRYRVPLSDTLSLDVDLPASAAVHADGLYLQIQDTILKAEAAGETYGVPRDPCHRFNEIAPAGGTVDSLVTAIRSQSLYRTSRPRPVEIGGASGRYLELRIPARFNASSCTDAQLGLPGNQGTNNNMEPGYLGRWWILDVGGQRTVLQALCVQCDAQASKRMTRMVQNITFTPAS